MPRIQDSIGAQRFEVGFGGVDDVDGFAYRVEYFEGISGVPIIFGNEIIDDRCNIAFFQAILRHIGR